jgi:hypothetical protein
MIFITFLKDIRNTDILIDEIDSSPLGLAVNRKDESEIATKSAIRHEERNAETLFNLETTLCILSLGNYTS